ncbi:activity-regulated cytoskeleton-associated protein-like [Drosophila takahashii]|uniref:activity-regulated cytoskeleton-associated protein-like n=1 Tax=Drosophila takahashii TaxID=29030 RepID=UPI00389903E1
MTTATLAEKLRNWGITFDGTTDPILFIQHLEERATAYEIKVEKMPQAIPGLLTDTAEHWFRTSQLLGKSWVNFKKAFLDFFLPPRYFRRLEDEIRTRHQRPGETFKQYLVKIRLMMHRAGYNSEQELERIYENLQPDYMLFNRRHEFTTLE